MDLTALTAISPIDGRYWSQANGLSAYFSEYSLIRYRVLVEVEYFLALCDVIPALKNFKSNENNITLLRKIYAPDYFGLARAQRVKDIEKTTNHDVKAVEYFLKDYFDENGWQEYREWIHFALTSQDINNTSIPLALKDAMVDYLNELQTSVVVPLETLARTWENLPMLARTHGQPATPTRLGKELFVFVYRVQQLVKQVKQVVHSAKFGGATGQFNAHAVAFPQVNWPEFGDKFVSSLGLEREQFTTQIANYDNMAALFDGLKRINTVLIDFARDMWAYISMEYFKQKIVATEVGSSAMPHKVNPIDFENAEGNLGMANALYEYLSAKLPISRLQRDLTDSTTLRNIGVPVSHSFLAFKSLKRGIGKVVVNEAKIKQDLLDNWIVVSEAIQTVLRREAYPNPYEALKALTRTGEHITPASFEAFVDGLSVSDAVKSELKQITPFSFIGQIPQH